MIILNYYIVEYISPAEMRNSCHICMFLKFLPIAEKQSATFQRGPSVNPQWLCFYMP